ncbi:MAG: YqgE/AlgH family protein [Pseudomonadaceae bacterium]|nr:YqgE/AlgH family protein [Pseudomonadaceae bacterium]
MALRTARQQPRRLSTLIVSNADNRLLAASFLLAMPSQLGSYFGGSIIYVCQHNDDGALGLIVNRRSDTAFAELIAPLSAAERGNDPGPANAPLVYEGGPVEPGRGFILHSSECHYDGSLSVTDEITLSASRDALAEIHAQAGPRRYLLALGYTGWGPGQLEREMQADAWLSCEADLDVLFDTNIDDKVSATASALGIDFSLMATQAGNA